MGACEQIVRARERLGLAQELRLEDRAMPVAELLLPRLVKVRQQRRDKHVRTLPNLIMNDLTIEQFTDAGERLLPSENVHVVAVHEGAVYVEKDGLDLHVWSWPCVAWEGCWDG